MELGRILVEIRVHSVYVYISFLSRKFTEMCTFIFLSNVNRTDIKNKVVLILKCPKSEKNLESF